MREFYISKITTKGQITIPLELRKLLKVEEGDYILFEKKGVRVEMKKMVQPNDFEEFAKSIRERFQAKGVTPDDVESAIKWARGEKEK